MPCLFLDAHHTGSLPMQLKVVRSPLLQAGFEGPPLISCAASWRTYGLKYYIFVEVDILLIIFSKDYHLKESILVKIA